jgi:hypothetical protein
MTTLEGGDDMYLEKESRNGMTSAENSDRYFDLRDGSDDEDGVDSCLVRDVQNELEIVNRAWSTTKIRF